MESKNYDKSTVSINLLIYKNHPVVSGVLNTRLSGLFSLTIEMWISNYFGLVSCTLVQLIVKATSKAASACFELQVYNDCANVTSFCVDKYIFSYGSTPDTMALKLECEGHQTITNITVFHMVPQYIASGNYCKDKNQSCSKDKPCVCCTQYGNICSYKMQEEITCDQANGRCDLLVQRMNLNKELTNDCIDYDCVFNKEQRCYTRWVDVTYFCEDNEQTTVTSPTTTVFGDFMSTVYFTDGKDANVTTTQRDQQKTNALVGIIMTIAVSLVTVAVIIFVVLCRKTICDKLKGNSLDREYNTTGNAQIATSPDKQHSEGFHAMELVSTDPSNQKFQCKANPVDPSDRIENRYYEGPDNNNSESSLVGNHSVTGTTAPDLIANHVHLKNNSQDINNREDLPYQETVNGTLQPTSQEEAEMSENNYYEGGDVQRDLKNEEDQMVDNAYYEGNEITRQLNEKTDNMVENNYYESGDNSRGTVDVNAEGMIENNYYDSGETNACSQGVVKSGATQGEGHLTEEDQDTYAYTYGHFRLEGRNRELH